MSCILRSSHYYSQSLNTSITFVIPGRALAGRGQAGSSERADSWRCSLVWVVPVRSSVMVRPDWPGCLVHYPDCWLGSHAPSGVRLDRVCPSWLLDLHKGRKTKGLESSPSILFMSFSVVLWVFFFTCSWTVGLTQVAGWRHWRHHQIKGYGDIHGSHVTGARPNHPNLVVSLEVHVGWTPGWKNRGCCEYSYCLFKESNGKGYKTVKMYQRCCGRKQSRGWEPHERRTSRCS